MRKFFRLLERASAILEVATRVVKLALLVAQLVAVFA